MKKLEILVLSAFFLFSCSKDDEASSVSLSLKGVNNNLKSANSVNAGVVKITDFKLSIRDVEFKKDNSDLDSNEVEFRGPYDVDLMDGTDALTQTIGRVEVPEDTYKVLRFKLHKDRDRLPSDDLYDRSILIKGSIDGVPFEFWHDTSENFDFEQAGGIQVAGGNVDIVVEFEIDQFLNSLHNIDLSGLVDEDQDGVIEIDPDDEDGHADVADLLKENIKAAADLIKL